MKIALIGTRGIPAAHGGFETCVEEIGQRLVLRGHKVTVYSKFNPKYGKIETYKGMRIVYIPRLPFKGIETLFAAFLSVIHSLFQKYDFHMVFDNANAPTLIIYKLVGKNYSINVDGLGWQRDKWGKYAKKYYKWSEWISIKLCNNIVTDSKAMADYYFKEYNAYSTTIVYGSDIPNVDQSQVQEILNLYGIEKKRYFLQITRFEPENNPLLTLQAFNNVSSEMSIVLIGGASSKTEYSELIKQEASKNSAIILPGFIYDKKVLDVIWTNSFCYVHGNHIGGTNPALLQAMAAGRPVISRDCVFNREVLEDYGYFYERNIESLCEQIIYVEKHINEAEMKAKKAVEKIKKVYRWDIITEQYERLFLSGIKQSFK